MHTMRARNCIYLQRYRSARSFRQYAGRTCCRALQRRFVVYEGNAVLTTGEVALRLGVSRRRVHALIQGGRLKAHRAEPAELAFLFEECRIRSVPAVGLLLVYARDLEAVAERPNGYPKGRPRKSRDD
jgi:hypothetical protein